MTTMTERATGSASGAWATTIDLSSLANELPDVALLIDIEKFKIRDVNRGPAGAFGYTKGELLACAAFTLFPHWWCAEKGPMADEAVATVLRQKDGAEV